ncbi:MAG TPA: FAD-dependent oxidoreductase [Candidatus Thermoplasmatota archaeon]|nr:FAD-dependent oxidoreductase [Candidatus Thermoplasmatota archaeon]
MPSGRHESLWIATAPGTRHPPLSGTVEADVAVVGAGIVGVTAAYLLKKAGKTVALLDRQRLLSSVTGKTTAKVTSQHGVAYQKLVKRFGEEDITRHAWANEDAIRFVEKTANDLGIDCHWKRAPNYVYTTDQKHLEDLRKEADLSLKLGLPASFTADTDLPFPVKGAVRFDQQAHFHPREFLLGLVDRIKGNGSHVHEDSPVTAIEDGEPCKVTTPGGTVNARSVIVATHIPILDKLGYTVRMVPKREYGIACPVGRSDIKGMYVSMDDPRRSVRPFDGPDGPMLVFVGETHPEGERAGEDHVGRLASFARESFGAGEPSHHWSSQDSYPLDDLPLVGTHGARSKNTWAATGFRAWGMTQGIVSARLLADRVLGNDNPLADLYDPFHAKRIVKELVTPKLVEGGVTAVRQLVVERLKPQAKGELVPGMGRVESRGLHKVAVYKDRDGREHCVSASCTHMGCILAFNPMETSWDCPCHGSRFGIDGEVLHGPATEPLKPHMDQDEA